MVSTPPRKSKVPNILGDWDDVRFFLAVAKTGSFSAAATQLNTKQTTVGRRIQALERRLGAKLFDRHRHGMEVTPAARGVLVQAESMLSNATSIERHLAGLDREMAGVVRVAATEGLAAQWLVPRLTELRRRHSDIVVQVIVGDQVLDLLPAVLPQAPPVEQRGLGDHRADHGRGAVLAVQDLLPAQPGRQLTFVGRQQDRNAAIVQQLPR